MYNTQGTIITRLVRWRVRDWISCFLACSSPLDEKPDPHRTSSSELQIRNMVLEMKDDGSKGNGADRKLSGQNRCRREKWANVKYDSTRTRSDDSSCGRSQDEEYIVFCFREDGAFDVVKDCKLEHLDSESKSPRSVNRKVEWEESKYSPSGAEAETGDNQIEDSNIMRRTLSADSRDSNKSDSSSMGSFSFPILHLEFMGSPVQMPKPEDVDTRKHKVHCARFQCCRF